MNKHDEAKLELGRSLRESTTLIEFEAIVEYNDETNWQSVFGYIPPEKINSEGYVEEVWIASESLSVEKEEVNGEVYSLLVPGWLVDFNEARIDRFVDPNLLPNRNLVVKYRIPNPNERHKTA